MRKHWILLLFLLLGISVLNYLVELNAYTKPQLANDIPVSKSYEENIEVLDFPISPITLEEHCVNANKERTPCHNLSNVQDGDILISKSSHTLLYRHGHAGIVVDAEEGLVIEALGYGTPSMLQPLSKWNYFPTVKVLRLKERDDSMISELVEKAKTQYIDIKYDILASRNNPNSTHCSDIVWKLYNEFGYDLDSNGGFFVSPQDISKSDYLYEVESYGFSANRPW